MKLAMANFALLLLPVCVCSTVFTQNSNQLSNQPAPMPLENSLMFAAALRQKKVSYELHVYEHGRHGVGLAPNDQALNSWPKLLENWLRSRQFTK